MSSLVYAIDFETFYSKTIGISTQGIYHYLTHPEFDAYLVSIVGTDGYEFIGHPKEVDWNAIAKADVWVSHNAAFDQPVYDFLQQTGKINAPEKTPVWHCSADLAAFLASPRSLKEASSLLLGVKITKDVRDAMKGKRWEDMTPEFREDVKKYALSDSKLCLKLWTDFSDKWPEFERRLSLHTREMCLTGLEMDKEKVTEAIRSLKNQIWQAEQQIPWACDDSDSKTLSPKALALECRKAGIEPPSSLAMDSEECAEWEETYGDKYPWVGAMRTFRRCNALLKKVETIEKRIRDDGRMTFGLRYMGAHTGRWSGDLGFNVQNLPRGSMFGVNLRHMIKAPKGKKLIVADLSQIEPRVLAWLADDKKTLNLIRNGMDLYEAHARATMNYNLSEPLKSAGEKDPTFKKMRQLAKARVLGLGYGCGPSKFVTVAKVLAGLDISPEESEIIVQNWRDSNPLIKKLWNSLEDKFRLAEEPVVTLELPSGRILTYRQPTKIKKVGGFGSDITALIPRQGKLVPVRIWGGVLCENLVQATSRDVFGEGVLRLHEKGYKVILTIHDEVVVEAEEHQTVEEVVSLLCQTPEWAPDLPVAAEGSECLFYEK